MSRVPFFVEAFHGNVGVGTKEPIQRFHVVGNTNVYGGIQLGGHLLPSSCNAYDLGSANQRWKDIYLSGNTIDIEGTKIKKDNTTGGLTIVGGNNNTLYPLYVSGNVGIGTTIPRASLDVQGSAYFPNTVGIGTTQTTGFPTIYKYWVSQSNIPDYSWVSICWAPQLSLFCAVADAGGRIMISSNGISWTTQVNPAGNTLKCVCWSPELSIFCAVASYELVNRVITCTDGINWVSHTTGTSNNWTSVCWSPNLSIFCAVADASGSNIMTSPNGIDWTTQSAPANKLYSVCWSPELSLFCAVAYNPSKNVMISADTITWTTQTLSGSFVSVCWSPQLYLFCAVGGSTIITSSNGTSWDYRTNPTANDMTSVCWSPELGIFCAVAQSGSGNMVITSSDGISWVSQKTPGNNWYSVCWSPSLYTFCAVAPSSGTGNRVMTNPLQRLQVNGTIRASTFVGDGSGLTNLPTRSQWLNAGSNIYYSAGTVGIGTTTSSYKLDVNGTLKANAFIGDGSALTNLTPSSQWTTNGTSIYFTGGNVGIGTTLPQASLHVANTTFSASGTHPRGPYMTMTTVGISPTSNDFLTWMQQTTNTLTNAWWFRASTPTYSIISGVVPTNISAYAGAVLVPDGRVVFVPNSTSFVGIYNPSTNAYSTVSAYVGANKYSGGVLLPDGRVLFVPYNSTNIGIFNPSTNLFSSINANITGSYKFIGGVVVPDGRVVFVPMSSGGTSAPIGIFDPSTNTYSTLLANRGYSGGVLLPDGRVIFIPASTNMIGIFNSLTGTFTSIDAGYYYSGGVLVPDGRIILVPCGTNKIGIFNPNTNTFSTITTTISLNFDFDGGILLPDGRVMFVPYDSTKIGIFDPTTNTYSTISGATPPGSGAYKGGILLPNGNVVFTPYNSSIIGIVSGFPIPPRQLCYHPCFNKF